MQYPDKLKMNHMRYILASSFLMLVLSACSHTPPAQPRDTAKGVTPTQGTFKVGTPYKVKGRWYYPKEQYKFTQVGMASWYGPNFHGKQTANGEVFNKYELTAAHKTLQMPSLVRVTNLNNGKSVVLRVNDRGPFAHERILDVSERGAELLGFKNNGTAKVKVELLEEPSRKLAMAAKSGTDTGGMEVAYNAGRAPVTQTRTAARTPVADPLNAPPASMAPQDIARLPPEEVQLAAASEVPGKVSGGRFMPEPVVINTLDKAASGEGIFVQAGSFGNPSNAQSLARKLGNISPAQVRPVNVNGATYHRVKLGPFNDMNQAHLALNRAVAAGHPNAIIVVD
jgi:rare lipoprotein A